MTLLLTFLATFWKPLVAGLAVVGGIAVSYLKGRQHGDAAATQRNAATVANANESAANAQQAQQAAEAKADASQAQAAAVQASLDAKATADTVSKQVDNMQPSEVADELEKNWSK
jgi:hypothetical protein